MAHHDSEPLTLDDMPTIPILYKTKWLSTDASPVKPPSATLNSKISVIRCDITLLTVDTIVNAANDSLLGGGGVDGAIHRAAGRELLAECQTLNGCKTGSAKITDAYRLPCKKVIHAVGPVYFLTKPKGMHETLLRGCYRKSLQLCDQHGLKSIAFSALSTGIYGYPSGEAADAAISEVRNFFDEGYGKGIERVVFCNFMEKDERAYQKLISKYFPDVKEEKAESPSATVKTETEESERRNQDASSKDQSEDDDWVNIDKTSVPLPASIEEVEDVDSKA